MGVRRLQKMFVFVVDPGHEKNDDHSQTAEKQKACASEQRGKDWRPRGGRLHHDWAVSSCTGPYNGHSLDVGVGRMVFSVH